MHADRHIQFRDLGRLNYADAFALQKKLQAQVIEARAARAASPDTPPPYDNDENLPTCLGHLLFVEHDPPVITLSRRKTARQHLIATPQQLSAAGVQVAETDRGGDITYHGPGQLVAYPIVDLNLLGLRLHGYMRLLEQIVIDTLAHFSINAHRDPEATGVWVPLPNSINTNSAPQSKICAMGVRVSRWVTMHGLALNVTTNLDHFNLIVPCGLIGRGVTSIQQLLNHQAPTMDQVKDALADQFAHHMQAVLDTCPS